MTFFFALLRRCSSSPFYNNASLGRLGIHSKTVFFLQIRALLVDDNGIIGGALVSQPSQDFCLSSHFSARTDLTLHARDIALCLLRVLVCFGTCMLWYVYATVRNHPVIASSDGNNTNLGSKTK